MNFVLDKGNNVNYVSCNECNFFTISFNIPYNQTIDSIILKINHLVANISLA